MTAKHQTSQSRGNNGVPSLRWILGIALATTLMVISIQHCMLSYSTPSAISSRSDVALDGFPPKPSNDRHLRTVNNLRRHESLMSTAADEIFSLHKKMLEEDSVFGAPFASMERRVLFTIAR